jgi:uncharacterized protein (DUF488 family)
MTGEVDLRSDFPRGTAVTIWTLGHSHHPLELVLERLAEHDIQRVADVRSRPYARRASQYNREELEESLPRASVAYVWLGDKLGQRPEGERFYDADGHTLYEELLKEAWFMKAIGLLEHDAGRERIALLCLEEQPERCHRWALIGKLLSERGARVLHIRRDGNVQSQQQVDYVVGVAQDSLFAEDRVWRSPEPMWDMQTRGGPRIGDDDSDFDDSPFST